jgi:hypothetical protein
MIQLYIVWCMALNPTMCIEREHQRSNFSSAAMRLCYRDGFIGATQVMAKWNGIDYRFGGIRCEVTEPNPVREHVHEMGKRLERME